MVELPESIRQQFIDAGWHPGRSVAVPACVPAGHPACEVLAAYGGLIILEREPAEDWEPSQELVFRELHPYPEVAVLWGQLLQTRLVGIASVDNDHGEFYIASDGRCFGSSNMHDAFYFDGETFAEAVEGMLLGRWSRPMLRPDQQSVTLYGKRYTRTSPELYHY